jgi:K+-transporting ATPase ATPase A chain
MGIFMTRVFKREKTFMGPMLRPVERLLYRVTGVDENHEMRWTEYAIAMLLFSLVSMVVLYLMQRLQGYLPFNPQKFGGVSPAHLAFNTAASFTTNTNWQAYSGETTMSYFTQMAGLAVPQLCLSRHWNSARDCVHSRHCPPSDANYRQFLG